MPQRTTRPEVVTLKGGEDLTTPILAIRPGRAVIARNYEPGINGGYTRIAGYERFDGQTSPSTVLAYELAFATGVVEIVVGDTVTGGTSGATAKVVGVVVNTGSWGVDAAGVLIIREPTGVFVVGEELEVSAIPCAEVAAETTGAADPAHTALAIEDQRALLTAVPGSGPVRGVLVYQDNVYAVRDNVGGTAGVLYQATPTGWVQVYAGFSPGGRYEFDIETFTGAAGAEKAYGANTIDQGFEFDGTTVTFIDTGLGPAMDHPDHVAAHRDFLFFSFPGGSVQYSPIGDPTGTWVPLYGAGELAISDEVTNMVSVPGGVLCVLAHNRTEFLYGTPGGADFQKVTYSRNAGGYPYTAQWINGLRALDDAGLVDVSVTDKFGDFEQSAFSGDIAPLINALRTEAAGAVVLKSKNQFRVYGKTGLCVIAGFKDGKFIGFTRAIYPMAPFCMTAGFLGTEEVSLVGAEDGFVYRMDTGTSFDGAPIESFLRLPFNHVRGPSVRKRFRRVFIAIDASTPLTVQIQAEFDFGSAFATPGRVMDTPIVGAGGLWNLDTWNEFTWSGPLSDMPNIPLDGRGESIGLTLFHSSNVVGQFTLQDFIFHYSPSRLKR